MPNSLFGLEARLEGSFAHFGSRSLVNVTSQLRREFGTHGRRSSHRSLQLPVALQAARATRGLHVTEGAPSVATNNETPLSSSGLFCPRALYPLWRINHRTFFFFFCLLHNLPCPRAVLSICAQGRILLLCHTRIAEQRPSAAGLLVLLPPRARTRVATWQHQTQQEARC